MITLHQFPGSWGLPSASPFCMKLETTFRMLNVPYQNEICVDFSQAPKGKVPYITRDDETMGDSGLIIARLQEEGLIAQNLPAQDLAFQRLIEDHLYFALVFSRWMIDANFEILKQAFFAQLPPHLQEEVPKGAREKVMANLKGHGIGLHNKEEIAFLANQDIEALAVRLGDAPYFNGEEPGLLDASAYAIVRSILVPQLPSSLQDSVREHQNLVDFNERVNQRYFPPKPVA